MWRIRSLSKAQGAAVDAALDAWVAVANSTAPADRSLSEHAVRQLYQAAGLDPPEIRWTLDPIALACEASKDSSAGACIRKLLERKTTLKLEQYIKPRLARGLTTRVRERTNPLHASPRVRRLTRLANGAVEEMPSRGGILFQLDRLVREKTPPLSPIIPTGRAGQGSYLDTQVDLSLVLYDIVRSVLGVQLPPLLEGLIALSRHCGPVLPMQTVCWLSERPSHIHIDDEGLLHHPDDAAVRFRSGLAYHYWHGASVPAEIMVPRADITPELVRDQTLTFHRRLLVERMGVEQFIAASGARVIDTDETGRLWIKSLGNLEWAAVEVVNGTPEPDGSHRHYFLQVPGSMRTARQAVAWTYGMEAEDYVVGMRT